MTAAIEDERAAGFLGVFGAGHLSDDPNLNARIWRNVEAYRIAAEANRVEVGSADSTFAADLDAFLRNNEREWFLGEDRSPDPNELAEDIAEWVKKRYCIHDWKPVPRGRGECCYKCLESRAKGVVLS